MEFYHASYPVVRLLWFYVEEEMVTSIKERAGIHPQEVFASQCDDEVIACSYLINISLDLDPYIINKTDIFL